MIITGMDHFQSVCKKKLVEWYQKNRPDTPIDLSNVFVVWSCKTLQNYKCLASTTISGDAGFEDGLMTPLCADIMQACHSYTEKSRSGRGVHILMRGKLPFSGKNNLAGVEIYQARRFFIMTGKMLIFPEIIDNQEAIDYVVEKYFKETEKTGSNSNMVQRIYSPKFPKPTGGRIFVRPDYPEIPDGGRNISLTSLAGALHNTGYTPMQIYQELQRVNKEVCKPPLPDRELQIIAESISRYRR